MTREKDHSYAKYWPDYCRICCFRARHHERLAREAIEADDAREARRHFNALLVWATRGRATAEGEIDRRAWEEQAKGEQGG